MKELKKAKLNEFVEMTDKEMKQVVAGSGGSGSSGGSWLCSSGYEWSWWHLSCMPISSGTSGTAPKIESCDGKSVGDTCSFEYNGSVSYGRCQKYAPNYTLHCSDLI